MTSTGIVVGLLLGCALLVWVVALTRRDRLYVGYGVIFVCGTLAALAVLLVPHLVETVAAASLAVLPTPSLTIVPIVIVVFLLVYVFTQITVLSNRVMRLTQELAIRGARKPTRTGSDSGEPR